MVIDTDEIIVPLLHKNWQEMLFSILNDGKWNSEPSSISIRNVYVFTQNSTEKEKSVFNKSKRSKVIQERDQYGKSFIKYVCCLRFLIRRRIFVYKKIFSNFITVNSLIIIKWKTGNTHEEFLSFQILFF